MSPLNARMMHSVVRAAAPDSPLLSAADHLSAQLASRGSPTAYTRPDLASAGMKRASRIDGLPDDER